jgi:hypothetical protein
LKSCSDNDKVTKQEVMNSISKKQEKTSSNVTNNNQENASEIIIEIPKSKKTLEQINNKKVMDNVSNNNDDVEKLYYFIIKNHSPFQLEDAKKKWSKLLIDVKAKMFSEFSFLIQAKQILFASENAMIVVYTRLMDVFEHNNNCFRTSFIQLIKPYFGTNFFIIGMDFISAQEYAKKYRQKDLDFTKINDFSLTQIKIID